MPTSRLNNCATQTPREDLKVTARRVKAALVDAFPGVGFVVTLDRSTRSLTIRWIDGPTIGQAARVGEEFEGAQEAPGGDGLVLCTTGPATRTRSGAHMILYSRHYSKRAQAGVRGEMALELNLGGPDDLPSRVPLRVIHDGEGRAHLVSCEVPELVTLLATDFLHVCALGRTS